MKKYVKLYVITGLLLATAAITSASMNKVDVLTLPELSDWEKQEFSGETFYELVSIDNRFVLKADSVASASGLVREIEVDLNKTPFLNWSWKVDAIFDNVEETTKAGDDYPARVYIVVSDGFFFWQTRALSYSWASKQPKGSHWPNAFTENAIMVAVQSGNEKVGEWVQEKRNILEDIKNLLGINATRINAVAIMTDTDNSKQTATAYYGDIFFTSY
jgi:hypothetical protein